MYTVISKVTFNGGSELKLTKNKGIDNDWNIVIIPIKKIGSFGN